MDARRQHGLGAGTLDRFGGGFDEAVENERLRTPDDLDAPEALLEMPVPEANPRSERPVSHQIKLHL